MTKMSKRSFGLISTVVDVTEKIESIADLTGIQSKEKAMILIKGVLGDEMYNQQRDIISSLIDFLCYITKNKKELNLNVEKKFIQFITSCCK